MLESWFCRPDPYTISFTLKMDLQPKKFDIIMGLSSSEFGPVCLIAGPQALIFWMVPCSGNTCLIGHYLFTGVYKIRNHFLVTRVYIPNLWTVARPLWSIANGVICGSWYSKAGTVLLIRGPHRPYLRTTAIECIWFCKWSYGAQTLFFPPRFIEHFVLDFWKLALPGHMRVWSVHYIL